MNVEVLKSFLLANYYLSERSLLDVNGEVDVRINYLQKENNKYHIRGNMNVLLDSYCMESDIFDCVLVFDKKKVYVNTKIETVNIFYSVSLRDSGTQLVKGDKMLFREVYELTMLKGNKYLLQTNENQTIRFCRVDEDYDLNKGIFKEFGYVCDKVNASSVKKLKKVLR